MDCIHYISRVDVFVGRSTHVDSLVFFVWPAVVCPNWVLGVRITNTNIGFDSF